MKKISTTLILFILLHSSVQMNSQVQAPSEIFDKIKNSVLEINCYDENNYRACWGSAVVISDDGIVATCYHIFKSGVKLGLEKDDFKIDSLVILGADPENDILVLKIIGNKFPAFQIANSDSVKVGETVYTLGNPLGFDNTFASGMITAIRDKQKYTERREIQFNASISHGSSGGALVNSKGELIGITSSSIDNGQNLNFAIPINEFMKINLIDPGDSLQLNAVASLCLGYNKSMNKVFYKTQELYNNYLKVFPYDISSVILSGKTYIDMSEYDSAISKLSYAISLDPYNKSAFYNRGQAYIYNHDTLDALADYNRAIELDPNYAEAYMCRAFFYQYEIKDYNNAYTDYTKAIEINHDLDFLFLYRAEVLLASGDTDKAINDLFASINYDEDIASTCYERGKLFSSLGYYEDAVNDYTHAIKLDPNKSSYYMSRAIEYSKNLENTKAIFDYTEVIKLDQYNSTAYNNLAYSYYHVNDQELALKCFNRALDLDKKDFDSYLGLSIISYTKKISADYRKYIEAAVKINPEIKNGSKGLAKLENLGYFWSKDEKEVLNKIFIELGYDKKAYKTVGKAKANKKIKAVKVH